MKKFIWLAMLLMAGIVCNAQPFYNWAKRFGGGSADIGNSIAVDASGNVFTTGHFIGTVDFDPGAGTFNLASVGLNDIFISKTDAAGRLVWAKRMGGSSADYGNAMTIDADGNIYVTGYFHGTADFDPGPGIYNLTSTGILFDTYVSKLDADGNLAWAKSFSSNTGVQGSSIAVDASGNVYTTGSMSGTVDFDPGTGSYNLTAPGGGDFFISKLDAMGNFAWAKCMGSTGLDNSASIAVDASGNVYTSGFFEGTVDFDPGVGVQNLTSVDERDIFISKLDAAGNFVWAKRIGGSLPDVAYSIKLDASGNVYTTGFFQGTVDFDPGGNTYNLTSAGSTDVFILKLNTAGDFVYAKKIGGTSNEYGNCITVDASGNVYATGYFSGTFTADPGSGTSVVSAGYFDIFIFKLNAAGNMEWAKGMGGPGNDYGQSISVDASGNIYTTGYFKETVDFDPGTNTENLVSAGDFDSYIAKFSPTANLTIIADAQTKVYGSADPQLTWQVSGFAYGENASSITGNLTRAAGENVGTYAIGLGSLLAPTGYTITYGSSDLTITPAALAITANMQTKVYGATDPTLTYTATGFANGDNNNIITGSLNRIAGENVGVYTINQNTLSAGSNYTVTYTGNDLAITPAVLAVTANAQTKVYGAADPALTYTGTGFANGDNNNIITGNLNRIAGENVGVYTINQNTLSAGSNYAINYTGNNLNITKAAQVITWQQDLTAGCTGILTLQLTASANSGLPINYTVANTGIAIVSGNVLTLSQSGETAVTAKQAGDANHLPATSVTRNLNYPLVSAIRQHFNDMLLFDNKSGEYVQWQWYKNGALVAGATTAWYSETTSLNGTYYALVTGKNGVQQQTCPITCTGSSTIAGGIKVYPNPVSRGATTTVTCDYSEAALQGARLLITDQAGIVRQQLTSVHSSNQITLPPSFGVYIITLILSNGQKTTVNALGY